MRTAYKIILEKMEDGYLVTVPDFDCNTSGKDIAEAMFMARDVIGMMGITWEDMGKEIPQPGTVKYERKEGEQEIYVDIDFSEYRKKNDNKKIKKTLSISSWLNKKAEEENINFSRTLEEALMEKLRM